MAGFPLAGKRPRRRGWRRRLLAALLVLLVAACAGGWYLSRPHRLARLTGDLLERGTGADVRIASAHLALNGQIDLEGLELRVPGIEAPAARLFEAANVRVSPDLGSLLLGRFRLRSVVLLRPTLHLAHDPETGRYNYQALELPRGDDRDAVPWLPDLFLRHGVIHFAELRGDELQPQGVLRLEGKLTQYGEDASTYYFALRQTLDGSAPGAGPMVRGTFDLEAQRVAASLEGFRFDEAQRQLLPARLRELWDRLDPTGSLPTLALSYDHDPTGGLHARLDVDGVALNLPVAEITPRLRDVTGRFTLTGDTLAIENLTGEVEGIRYTISGLIGGREPDAPLHLNVSTEPFDIPKDPPIVPGLPANVREHYERFNPSGRFRVQFALDRPERGAKLQYNGTLDLLGVQGRYHKFPYPAKNLRGRVRFSQDQAVIEEIRGEALGGGELVMTGTITPPGEGAAVDIRVVGTNLPIDQHLLDAMEPKHRKVFDMFFNTEAHRSLVERGVIRSDIVATTQPPSDDAPTFDLGGRMDAVIDIHRPLGPGHRNLVTTRLRSDSARLLFEHWPYPLEVTGGEVVIAPDEVRVHDITVRGPTGGTGTLRGHVARLPRDKGVAPDLTIADASFPIDAVLLASIPAPQDQWVRRLHLDGTVQATGSVFAKPPETAATKPEIGFEIDLALADGVARPHAGDFTLRDLAGELTLRRDAVTLSSLTGRGPEGTLSVAGEIGWAHKQPRYDLRFTADDLAFDRSVIDLLPPEHDARDRLADLFETHRLTGRTDATLTYANTDPEAGEAYRLTLQPQALAFDLNHERVALHGITGSVTVGDDEAELVNLAAEFEHGALSASGLLGLGEEGGAALNLSARADRIDATTRAFLPAAALKAVDALALRGGYELEAGRLLWRPSVTEGPRLEFEGRVRLSGAAASVGVPITELDGTMDLRVVRFAGIESPHIDLTLHADQLRAADRLVAPLDVHLASSETVVDVLELKTLHGTVYDGVLTGAGSVDVRPQGGYRLDLALQDVRVEPFIDPETATSADPPPHDTGRLAASLAIEARYDDPASRRGRGALEVRDAALFQRPLAMALLQTANLSLPTSGSFDRAAAHYLIHGDRVQFDRIRFETPSVAIAGKGDMDYPSRRLDLTMFARNTAGPTFGVISEMINVFKDQLICIQVTGTLDAPQTRVVSFEGLRDTWRTLFGQATPPTP